MSYAQLTGRDSLRDIENCLYCTQDTQYQLQFYGWAANFHNWLKRPPTLPLNPINPDNARILRITAAAGAELADPYSYGTYKKARVPHFIPV